MKQKILAHYDYDDIIIGANNLGQILVWLRNRYRKLNKSQKDSLRYLYLDNTYMGSVIEQIENDIKEEKRRKIKEKYNMNEEDI